MRAHGLTVHAAPAHHPASCRNCDTSTSSSSKPPSRPRQLATELSAMKAISFSGMVKGSRQATGPFHNMRGDMSSRRPTNRRHNNLIAGAGFAMKMQTFQGVTGRPIRSLTRQGGRETSAHRRRRASILFAPQGQGEADSKRGDGILEF